MIFKILLLFLVVSVEINLLKANIDTAVDFIKEKLNRLKSFENHLADTIELERNSPSHGQLIENLPSDDALNQNLLALMNNDIMLHMIAECKLDEMDKNIDSDCLEASKINIPEEICLNYLQNYNFITNCSSGDLLVRHSNGHCNNRNHPSMGQSMTAYRRLFNASYVDFIWEPRGAKHRGNLPLPREISTAFQNSDRNFHSQLTMAFAYWGQFLLHDLTHTAVNKMVWTKKPIECCDRNGWPLSQRNTHKFCSSIILSDKDSIYGPKWIHCMNYVRSLIALPNNCKFDTAQQMNLATHYLDASQLYGTTLNESRRLRTYRKGLLKSVRHYLNRLNDSHEFCHEGNAYCYLSGDSRVNSNLDTAILYTIFQREHNRIAKKLAKLNSTWSDVILFEHSRRIVIAEMQHITYNQWLPEIFGSSMLSTAKYNNTLDLSISNSFSVLFSAMVNSMMVSDLKLFNEKQEEFNNVRLKNHYFRNISIIEHEDIFNGLLRGMYIQHSDEIDLKFTNDVVNDLYTNDVFGFDAFSLDIQRGRDHGLPNYNTVLSHFGKKVNSFDDLEKYIDKKIVSKLRTIYNDVDDIDLIVGSLSEQYEPNSITGHTMMNILREQFERTRDGDYFFYTNTKQYYPFTKEQIQEIEKVSLASIICWNSNLQEVEENVFKFGNGMNLKNCSSFAELNLTKFIN